MGQLISILEEDKYKSVLTTRNIVALKTEITYVTYDEDGDWQFFDDNDYDENEILLISLEQIISIDNTLSTLPKVKLNETYIRNKKDDEWEKLKD